MADQEQKGEEGTFSLIGGGSENGVREERAAQAFSRSNSLANPKMGGEVGESRPPPWADCPVQIHQESNETEGDLVTKVLGGTNQNCSGGFFHEPKNPPTRGVGTTQMEGPAEEQSRIEPANSNNLMDFFPNNLMDFFFFFCKNQENGP